MATISAPSSALGEAAPAAGPVRLYDGLIVFLVGLLMCVGVVMVYSASVQLAPQEAADQAWWRNTQLRQSLFALIGFLAMLVVAHMDYLVWSWRGRWSGFRVAGLVGLAAVLLVLAIILPDSNASGVGGQRSVQIRLGPLHVNFQAAEFAKVALVIALAAVLSRPEAHLLRRKNGQSSAEARLPDGRVWPAGGVIAGPLVFRVGFVPAVLAAGLLVGLTGIADFGTAALMGAVMFMMLILGGARWTHLGLIVLLGGAAAAGMILMAPYRVARLMSFLSDAPDASKDAYQVTQSLIAIGSGSWWGRGLGAGVQKYGYLPQDNNDFIMAIVCEELGVAGGIALIVIFLALLWRGWRVAETAGDPFGRLLAAGLTLMICLQAAFNVGVVTHALPTKGISLPFVSAGGSGVIFLGIAAGLLASVGRRSRVVQKVDE